MKFIVLIVLLLHQSHGTSNKEEDTLQRSPVVRTKYGHVQGRLVNFEDAKLEPVFVFKGLPYATPPVGSNR